MKTIKISDEMYNSLKKLSEEINYQDDRATQMPYFFQIKTKEQISVPEGCGTEAWNYDGSLFETDEEIKDAVFECKDWDKKNQSEFDKLRDFEIDEILRGAGYNKVNYDYKDNLENSFFTAKACQKHIKGNKHHYKEPVDYLSFAFRNPELELVFKFLCELTGGKLHK